MKQAFKKFGLIDIVLVFIPLIASLSWQITQKQSQETHVGNAAEARKFSTQRIGLLAAVAGIFQKK